jgi:hypothetical protein
VNARLAKLLVNFDRQEEYERFLEDFKLNLNPTKYIKIKARYEFTVEARM